MTSDRIAGRYTIGRLLGRGGMGDVFEAHDDELGHRVAIKVLHAARLGDPRTAARLRREIATTQRITHPNVCRVHDVEPDAGFCTMELLEGETLAARIARGALSTTDALPIVEQLCAGLTAAHQAGVVHRDFKPHNVMLCGDRAVITDFGLAVALEGNDATQSIVLAVTPAYLAPEQLGTGAVSTATDVYALGVTMFEMVTGALPFAESTPIATALARVHGPAPSARSRMRGLDRRWDDVIARCLARDPAARPAVSAIVPALRGRPTRRHAGWLVAVAIASVAAAGVGVAAMMSRGPVERPPVIETYAGGVVARVVAIDGPGPDGVAASAEDRDGNLYLVGYASRGSRIAGATISHAGGGAAGFVAKIDVGGRLRWLRTIASTATTYAEAVAVDDAGSVFVFGWSQAGALDLGDGPPPDVDHDQGFVVALDALDGATVWSRRVERRGALRAGAIGPDGHVYAVGDNPSSPGAAVFVTSYERGGAPRWSFASEGGREATGTALAFDGDVVVFGGGISGDVRFADIAWKQRVLKAPFLCALDRATGQPRWARRLSTMWGHVWGLASAGPGELRVLGRIDDLGTLVGTSHGDPILEAGPWTAFARTRDGELSRVASVADGDTHAEPIAIVARPDGSAIVAGRFPTPTSLAGETIAPQGVTDVFVAVVDAGGRTRQLGVIGGEGEDSVRGAQMTGAGTIGLWGVHRGGLTIGDVTLPYRGVDDGFYVELRLDELVHSPAPSRPGSR